MGVFDFFKKKTGLGCEVSESDGNQTEERLDDVTFIQEMQHLSQGPWHQYDIGLAARGYGWDYMLDWADYMAVSDLKNISQVTTSECIGSPAQNITDSYHAHNGKCMETPELATENGVLSIAGISRTLNAPMKIVWFNQTRCLRLFTFVSDELLIKKYAETLIRRTFGTENAMKLGKDIPEGQ